MKEETACPEWRQQEKRCGGRTEFVTWGNGEKEASPES